MLMHQPKQRNVLAVISIQTQLTSCQPSATAYLLSSLGLTSHPTIIHPGIEGQSGCGLLGNSALFYFNSKNKSFNQFPTNSKCRSYTMKNFRRLDSFFLFSYMYSIIIKLSQSCQKHLMNKVGEHIFCKNRNSLRLRGMGAPRLSYTLSQVKDGSFFHRFYHTLVLTSAAKIVPLETSYCDEN